MFVLVVLLIVVAVAAVTLGTVGLLGRLPQNRWVGVRTAQTDSDELLWRTANRVAGPGVVVAGAIFGFGAIAVSAMPLPWSLMIGAVTVVAGLFLAGYAALQGARAASIQASIQVAESSTCCSDDGAGPCGPDCTTDHAHAAADPAADCGVSGGCGACALKGMCDHEAKIQ